MIVLNLFTARTSTWLREIKRFGEPHKNNLKKMEKSGPVSLLHSSASKLMTRMKILNEAINLTDV